MSNKIISKECIQELSKSDEDTDNNDAIIYNLITGTYFICDNHY